MAAAISSSCNTFPHSVSGLLVVKIIGRFFRCRSTTVELHSTQGRYLGTPGPFQSAQPSGLPRGFLLSVSSSRALGGPEHGPLDGWLYAQNTRAEKDRKSRLANGFPFRAPGSPLLLRRGSERYNADPGDQRPRQIYRNYIP